MNNKGMTIVELIVTFSLLLVLIVGMFNLVMDVKIDFDTKQIAKDFTEYSSTMNHQIQYDFITKTVNKIYYKNNDNEIPQCYQKNDDSCSAPDFTSCKKIFPCLIYEFTSDKDNIKTKTIALNTISSNNKIGIYYDNVLEPIPNQDYVFIKSENSPNIKYENNLLIIDFPYYMIDNDNNYGFKIVVPFSKQ